MQLAAAVAAVVSLGLIVSRYNLAFTRCNTIAASIAVARCFAVGRRFAIGRHRAVGRRLAVAVCIAECRRRLQRRLLRSVRLSERAIAVDKRRLPSHVHRTEPVQYQ